MAWDLRSRRRPVFEPASRFALAAFHHPMVRLASLLPICAAENVGSNIFGPRRCQVSIVRRKQIARFARNVYEAATYIAQQVCERDEASSRRLRDGLDLTFY